MEVPPAFFLNPIAGACDWHSPVARCNSLFPCRKSQTCRPHYPIGLPRRIPPWRGRTLSIRSLRPQRPRAIQIMATSFPDCPRQPPCWEDRPAHGHRRGLGLPTVTRQGRSDTSRSIPWTRRSAMSNIFSSPHSISTGVRSWSISIRLLLAVMRACWRS